MYLIQGKGGDAARFAINREISMVTILNQLPDLDDQQLEMTADYIRGLKTAEIFRSR